MMTNSPCALERMLMSVSLSTNREPEMLKKSNATPYTSMERINIHTPLPGLPKPNKANRNTHASMAISITLLIPNLLRKKGMSRMHRVSDTCESEIRILACCTPKVFAYSGMEPKLLIYGLANPLVICKDTPKSMEKIKKMAIFLLLNNVKARNPKASTNDLV